MSYVMTASTDAVQTQNSTVKDYFELLKPRVMVLVVFTAIIGLMIAPGDLHPFLSTVAIFCIAMGAGAAGAINMWYDRDIDAVMSRTKNRPIPEGRVDADEALAFGMVLSVLSVLLMGLAVNWMAAGILAFASFFYVVIYTMWLKRSTPQNIVIGGAAGAFPPMIGWVAVTGQMTIEPMILFAIIFMWTPPHFWALALYKCKDYQKVGVPMLPAVSGDLVTKRQMLAYTIALVPLCLAPYFLGFADLTYAIGATLLNLVFVISAIRVYQEKTGYKSAQQMFGFSILYLFGIFTLLLIGGV